MERLVGRYDLVEQVTSGKGRTLWRGHDVVLDRPVGILVLDRDHPHAANVRTAAQAAARIEHPSILRVVDADLDDGRVLVVTRWLRGKSLADLLASGPLDPAEATRICRDVASALAASSREGVHHLVLDPRDILITDHGVALVGVGVRAALEGVSPDDDAEQVDAWRLGAVAYAALTARWPGHRCAGLPAAPNVGGQVARPRQVRAGVPLEIDDVVWRALRPDAHEPLETPAAIAEAFAAINAAPGWVEPNPSVTVLPWRTLGVVVIGTLFIAGLLLVGWQFWQDQTRDEPTAADIPTSPTPSASPTPSTTIAVPLRISAARAFDPAGDGEENDEEAAAAVDGDPATSWSTLTYASRALGELKPGVGLELRLKGMQSVGGIDIELVGRGSDLKVLAKIEGVASTAENPLAGYQKLASVQGAGDQVPLTFVPPAETRSILVWLTALPADETGYRGGVAEVRLFS